MDNEAMEKLMVDYEYAGFWIRFGASCIDTLIILCITVPALYLFYGDTYFQPEQTTRGVFDAFITYGMPLVATILFWKYRSATPGKMAVKVIIIDAKTGENPTTAQCFIRYFAYFLSTIPLCLGFLWIAWDAKKQGWHDKLAGTIVVRPKGKDGKTVEFREK